MRVTGNSFTSSLMDQLNQLAARQYRLQNQVSTGQRITAPEDDPAAMQQVLNLRADEQTQQQFSSNIGNLHDRANASYAAIQALQKISSRVGEIATLADGTKSPTELQSYATELTQLIKQAVDVLNGKENGSYLFGGTASGQPPFTIATDANGNVTGVTYNGNTSVSEVDIGDGVSVSADVPGANTTGSGPRGLVTDSRTGADFFNHLISLQNHLLANDTASIAGTDRGALSKDEDNILFHVSNNGAIQTRLDAAASVASSKSTALDQQISNKADADMTDTIVKLNQAQNSYQAALQSSGRIMQMSLMDYLQ